MNYNCIIKKAIIALCCIFIVNASLWGQAATFDWVKQFGSTGFCQPAEIELDAWGNIYTTGTFQGSGDFDPGTTTFNLTAAGTRSTFISKLDSTGVFKWAKSIGGAGFTNGFSITTDTFGNVYVTGRFQNTVDFNPGSGVYNLTPVGSFDIFILKLDSAGEFSWAKSIGGSLSDDGCSIETDHYGNVYIVGNFQDTVDFNPGGTPFILTSFGTATNVFVTKLDSAGNFKWAKQIEGKMGTSTSASTDKSLYLDQDSDIYIVGAFSDTADFDPGPNTANLVSAGSNDGFICKWDSAGNYIWAKAFGGKGTEFALSLAVDPDKNVYVSGRFTDTADFDPGTNTANLISKGDHDIFILKLDSSGNYVWARGIGGTTTDIGQSIALDERGNVYTTGYFSNGGAVNFDPVGAFNLTAPGNAQYQVFISILDNSGSFVWAGQMGGSTGDGGAGIAIRGDAIFTTGYLSGTNGDWDPGPGTHTLRVNDGMTFVHKMNKNFCNNTYSDTTVATCDSFTLNGQTYTSTGSYNQTFPNAQGCDSIIVIDLTINQSTVNTPIFQTVCDSFTFNGQTYKQSGSYTQTYPNAVGCDSIITLNLTVNNSSSATLTRSSCDTFILGDSTYTASGTYTYIAKKATGCDSVITLNLTIHNSVIHNITETACDRYILNGETYTASGIYTQHHFTTQDCDSTVVLDLTIHSSPSATVTTTSATTLTASSGDSYQWLDCAKGFAPVAGATGQIFTPDTSGNYAVVITENGCSDTSDCVAVTIEDNSIHELYAGNRVQLYPNPANRQVTVAVQQPLRHGTIRLFNIIGQLVMEKTHQQGSLFVVDVSAMAKGIYFVEISNQGKTVKMKMVRE